MILGIALTIVAFAILMSFDTQLSFLIFAPSQTSGEGGTAPSFQPTRTQFFSVTAYIRLSSYLVGLAGIVITSLGILLEPKKRPKSDDVGARKDSFEQRPVQVVDASTVKPLESPPEEKHQHVSARDGVGSQKTSKTIIKLESVVKTYGDGVVTPALNGVSLEVFEGEFVAIVGPSGSGKSTLLNMIGALDKPTSGKIFIDGVDISKLNDRELAALRNRKIGFIFQSFNLIHRMTALSNVEFPLTARNILPQQRRQMAQKVLQLVGLGGNTTQPPSKLSGGEMQRVAVARALSTEPVILLADEPTGNLDTTNTKAIMEMLTHLNETTGRTILMITHNMELAAATERIIHLRDGQIEKEEFPNLRGAA